MSLYLYFINAHRERDPDSDFTQPTGSRWKKRSSIFVLESLVLGRGCCVFVFFLTISFLPFFLCEQQRVLSLDGPRISIAQAKLFEGLLALLSPGSSLGVCRPTTISVLSLPLYMSYSQSLLIHASIYIYRSIDIDIDMDIQIFLVQAPYSSLCVRVCVFIYLSIYL